MIGGSLYLIGTKDGSKFFHFLSRQTIDDTALPWMLTDEADDVLIHFRRLLSYLVVEVRTIEGALKLLSIHNTKTLLDICTHLIGGSGSKGDNRCVGYLIDRRTYPAILRTEVVAPF